jgi:hypothetical protein
MTSPVRAEPFVTQMPRGQLHARSCRHVRVDGPDRPSGRTASPSGITPSTIMSPARTNSGSRTEIRLGARAHTITTPQRAHPPPRQPGVQDSNHRTRAACGRIPAQIRSVASPRLRTVR